MTLTQEIDALVASIDTIPAEKKYWLIRTQSGSLYDTFIDNNIVSIDHTEISLSFLNEMKKHFGDDKPKIVSAIRSELTRIYVSNQLIDFNDDEDNEDQDKPIDAYEDEDGIGYFIEPDRRKIGLVANQIYKFYFEVKKGDIVIIPSSNSDVVSFGIVQETNVGNFSKEEVRRIESDAILIKRVQWIEHIMRTKLDPYLFRLFTAHHAVSDVSSYAPIIERSLRNLFIIDDEAHMVIEVQTHDGIRAIDLFGLGSEILTMLDEFSRLHNLDISSSDLELTINLNSPGKLDFKSNRKKSIFTAAFLLFMAGGGLVVKNNLTLKTDGLPGLISAYDKYEESRENREMRRQIFDRYKDSLKITTPDDLNKVIKQFSDNKDLPK